MEIDKILAKNPQERTPEENTFITEHESELTDEQKVKVNPEPTTPANPPVELGTETPPAVPVSEEDKEKERKEEEKKEELKKKLRASARESQILTEKLSAAEIENIEPPTEEEMREIHPDWDVLSDFEKSTARRQWITEKKLENIGKVVKEAKNETNWSKKVDDFVEKAEILEEYPALTNKKEDFKRFAMMPTHRGVPLEVLAKSFLFDNPDKPVTPTPTPQPIIETGGAGTPPENQPQKMTPEQVATLKSTDYKKYLELVKKGIIAKELST